MKYYYFTKNTDAEPVSELIKFIHDNEGELTIYLSSVGGDNWSTQVVLDVFAQNKDRITLKAVGEILSNAFRWFFSTKCKREIFPSTNGMMHLSGKSFRLTERGKVEYTDEKFCLQEFKKDASRTLAWCKEIGMNKKEIAKIKCGEDQWFTNERLQELLTYQMQK